jgi:hypothetical protein
MSKGQLLTIPMILAGTGIALWRRREANIDVINKCDLVKREDPQRHGGYHSPSHPEAEIEVHRERKSGIGRTRRTLNGGHAGRKKGRSEMNLPVPQRLTAPGNESATANRTGGEMTRRFVSGIRLAPDPII